MDNSENIKARKLIEDIITISLVKTAKEEGFKKKRLTFFRRNGLVVQLINIQLSAYNIGSTGSFFVNIAFAFDEFRNHQSIPITEAPVEYMCDFRRRLEHIIPGTPYRWEVSSKTDINSLANEFNSKIIKVFNYLNRIDSLSSFIDIALKNKWFALPGEYDLLASFQEVVGDLQASKENKRLFQEFLHNREIMSWDEFDEFYGLKV